MDLFDVSVDAPEPRRRGGQASFSSDVQSGQLVPF